MKLSILMLCLSLASFSYPAEYHVDTEAQNKVRFISDAKVETFDGVTGQIDGYVVWDNDAVLVNNKFYFEVELQTLDTGIGLRNRHMRENYLETETYPYATYEGTITEIDSAAIDSGFIAFTEGTFSVHGVEKPLEMEVQVTPDDDQYQAYSEFQVLLSDHYIKIPKLMFLKLSEIIQLQVKVYMQPVQK
ncbi:MAG: YceI family protein [candidate division KSB1 bacterium]|nr:YceI family protein [candidate division KSB1 bacterium]